VQCGFYRDQQQLFALLHWLLGKNTAVIAVVRDQCVKKIYIRVYVAPLLPQPLFKVLLHVSEFDAGVQ